MVDCPLPCWFPFRVVQCDITPLLFTMECHQLPSVCVAPWVCWLFNVFPKRIWFGLFNCYKPYLTYLSRYQLWSQPPCILGLIFRVCTNVMMKHKQVCSGWFNGDHGCESRSKRHMLNYLLIPRQLGNLPLKFVLIHGSFETTDGLEKNGRIRCENICIIHSCCECVSNMILFMFISDII